MRFLFIEDNQNLAHPLKQGLTRVRFAVDLGSNPSKGGASVAPSQYMAAILDLDLAHGRAHSFSRIHASKLSKNRLSGYRREASRATRSSDNRLRRQLRKWVAMVQIKIVRGVGLFLSEGE